MTSRGRLTALLLLAPPLVPAAAFAQTPPAPPPISFERREATPALRPQAEAPAEIETEAAPTAPSEAPAFTLTGVALDGATTLSEADLADLWAPLIGTEVSLADLEALAQRIGARYRARGFVLSQAVIPPQRVEDGVVTVRVVEGFVDQIRVDGGDQTGVIAARRFTAPVSADRPLRLVTLERGVLLTRDALGEDVDTVLEPSPNVFGAADLTVLLPEGKQSYGFAAVDNRASRLYGGWVATGGVTLYDHMGLTERLDLLAAVAPDENYFAFGQATFSVPPRLFDGGPLDGTRIEAQANHTSGEPDLEQTAGGAGFSALQRETNATLALVTPFVRTRSENLTGRLGLTYRDSASTTKFAGVSDRLEDRLWILDGRVTWDFADSFGGVTLLDAGLRQGLDIGGAEIGGGDVNGSTDFTAFDASLIRLQRIGETDWSIYALATGQLAGSTLPSSERFGLGGDTLGRGFAPGNTTGDSGFGGRLELRRTVFGAALDDAVEAAQFYAFGDWGQAVDRRADRDGDRWETIASVGLGVRIDVTPWLTVTPEVVRQLSGAPVDRLNDDEETRFFITAVGRF
jgi:hemolysin activation/secretion protein